MASIEGFTAELCQALASAQVGDVLLIQGSPKPDPVEEAGPPYEVDSEGSQNGEEDGGEEVIVHGNEEEATVEQEDQDEEDEGDGNEDDESVEHEDEQEDEVQASLSPKVYLIHKLSKDEEGNITDITLRNLTYCLKPADSTASSFHIYGSRVKVKSKATDTSPEAETLQPITDVLDISTTTYTVRLKPTGHELRSTLFNNRCPAQCADGWLPTQEEMHALVAGPTRLLSPYRPVCPVCISKTLTQRLQALREHYDDTYQADISAVIDFYADLNPRRKALGYSFTQFDERAWGLQFDDMLSESSSYSDRGGGGGGGYWEQWDEASDPNANPTFHAASAEAIAALPVRKFVELGPRAAQVDCLVCTEAFADEAVVATLPCGHYFDVACVQAWLKMSNGCPTCRQKLPEVATGRVEGAAVEAEEGGGGDDVEAEGSNGQGSNAAADTEVEKVESEQAEVGEVDTDGEDLVMGDTESGCVTA